MLRNIVTLAIIAAAIYAFLQWRGGDLAADDVAAFAERDCEAQIKQRFRVSRVTLLGTEKNSKGYVIRATVTLDKGGKAKVTCVTNAHGGVRDIAIEER